MTLHSREDKFLKPYSLDFFSNKKLNNLQNSEEKIYRITQEGFLELISFYKKEIAKKYKKLLKQIENDNIEELFTLIFFKSQEWNNECVEPFNKSDHKRLVRSDSTEYLIFELVSIYKNVNWEKEYINALLHGDIIKHILLKQINNDPQSCSR